MGSKTCCGRSGITRERLPDLAEVLAQVRAARQRFRDQLRRSERRAGVSQLGGRHAGAEADRSGRQFSTRRFPKWANPVVRTGESQHKMRRCVMSAMGSYKDPRISTEECLRDASECEDMASVLGQGHLACPRPAMARAGAKLHARRLFTVAPMTDAEKAAEYRRQAGKMRADMAASGDEYARKLLREMAEAYDRLAGWIERRSKPGI